MDEVVVLKRSVGGVLKRNANHDELSGSAYSPQILVAALWTGTTSTTAHIQGLSTFIQKPTKKARQAFRILLLITLLDPF